MNDYEQFIHLSRYARWDEERNKREDWRETVKRYIDFFVGKGLISDEDGPESETSEAEDLFYAVYSRDVMPSMRCMATAGTALDRDNVAGFNCSYTAVDHPRVFDEIMYILMCGTGVGFSVERQYTNKLPEVPDELHKTDTIINVADSKIGWASAFRELIALLYSGNIPNWDTSRVRPAGARLKTFGGRASGPEPLEDLFKFTIEIFRGASGRRLNSVEVHDVVCKIADIVVVGGVRRSALISLSNLTDERMRGAKAGQWWEDNPQRAMANNSVCYTEHPDIGIFMREWESLYASKSGERGIFSRAAAKRKAEVGGRRDSDYDFGTNPCSEIILRSGQFCNLSEVIVRPTDDFNSLRRKVRYATIIGTLQATLTKFRYLRSHWRRNTEEEALLGVSLTGIMDHSMLSGDGSVAIWDWGMPLSALLKELKEVAIETNKEWAERLGINQSVAITCVKPSGTVSQLCNTSSGIHPRYSPFYIRRVRADKKDPLATMMIDCGFPVEEDLSKPDSHWVFSFPIKSPEQSVMRDDITALDQLELWKVYAEHWCEHKPSITVYVREHEWLKVGAWIYDNFDICSGISFLPHSDHIYRQAPYEEITEEQYNTMLESMPNNVNWFNLIKYENADNTVIEHELACSSGSCEIH